MSLSDDPDRELSPFAERIRQETIREAEIREDRTWRGGGRDLADEMPSSRAGALAEEAVTKGASDALAVNPPLLEAFSRTAPAEAIAALRGAHGRLLTEFRKSNGRDPTATDEPFWAAWRAVLHVFNEHARERS